MALIEEAVEVAEKVYDLVCRAVRGNVCEANDVAKEYGCFIEHLIMIIVSANVSLVTHFYLRLRHLTILHLLQDCRRQQGTQKFLSL